jgi:hypothetical protein
MARPLLLWLKALEKFFILFILQVLNLPDLKSHIFSNSTSSQSSFSEISLILSLIFISNSLIFRSLSFFLSYGFDIFLVHSFILFSSFGIGISKFFK